MLVLGQEEMLQKAIDTTDLAGGGLLSTGQAERFVDLSLDQSVMLRDARVVRMRSAVMELDKIATSGRVSQLRTEGVAPASLSEPSFSKVTLTAVDIITPFEITMEALEDSIERGDLEDTVIRVMARQTATDLEELAIQGDTGSADEFLQGLDGWRVLSNDGHLVDFLGATLDKSGLASMYKALPNRYKRNQGELRFYFAPAAVQDWHDTFSDRASALGDEALTSAAAPPYMGVPVVSVPNIPTDQEGVEGYSGSDLTYGFLTPRENLVFGIHRDIRIDKDRDILRGVNIYTITTRVAVEFEEDDAVVVAVNVAKSA
ncbi:MAG: phage major capsid protein [Armatimonadota bacterium]|nr:phage major capsid protein [Armatimonadota bacterium]